MTGFLMLLDMFSVHRRPHCRSYRLRRADLAEAAHLAISTCLFSFTLAFLIGRLKRTRRFAAPIGSFVAIALVLEIVLIDLQARRYTASHFNNETAFEDEGLRIHGHRHCRRFAGLHPHLDRYSLSNASRTVALGQALRLGMALALAGMATGALMTLPSKQQLADMKSGKPIPRVGAHTVGAPDGGPWACPLPNGASTTGDLRIAHFVGLHAAQLLLLGWWLVFCSGWPSQRRLRLIWAIAASAAGVFAIVLMQALRGQPFLEPDLSTLQSWLVWLALTLALLIWAIRRTGRRTSQDLVQKDNLQSTRRMQ